MSKHTDISTLSKEELVDQVRQLQHQVALLQKMVFGPRNERFKLADVPANQLSLGVSTEALAEVKVEKTAVKGHDRSKVKLEVKQHPGRNPLPSSLRREEIIIEPSEDVSDCVRLEDEVTEVLEVKAGRVLCKALRSPQVCAQGG